MLIERKENQKNMKIKIKENINNPNQLKSIHKENNVYKKFINSNKKTIIKNEKIDPLKILFVTESEKIKKFNLENILTYELLKSPKNFRENYFPNQNLSEEIRARMVDWMVEVLSSFNCSQNTFFVSLDILDAYLTKTQKTYETRDIHLLGVTAMLIASKMEEIIPFKISTIVEKMTHNKINGKDILEMEYDIIKTMEFRILSEPSLFVFIEFLLVKLNLHKSKYFEDIMKVVTYISKMLMHNYKILIKFPLKYLAASCIYICLKIIEQVNFQLKAKNCVEKLKSLLNLEENIFYHSSEILLDLAKNFENEFPFSKNLLKFDSFSLEKGGLNK